MSKELAFYKALVKAADAAREEVINPKDKSNTFMPLVDAAIASTLSRVAKAYREVFLE